MLNQAVAFFQLEKSLCYIFKMCVTQCVTHFRNIALSTCSCDSLSSLIPTYTNLSNLEEKESSTDATCDHKPELFMQV